MTETEYYSLARACDSFILQSDANPVWIANPFFHLLSEHPIHMTQYMPLLSELNGINSVKKSFPVRLSESNITTDRIKRKIKKGCKLLWAMATGKNKQFLNDLADIKPVDAVIVSWLVNTKHLKQKDDFYFGPLQSILAERGFTSLLILGNQSGQPSVDLMKEARRDGSCSRRLLPDIKPILKEAAIILKCILANRQLKNKAEGLTDSLKSMTGKYAAKTRFIGTLFNLRMQAYLADICLKSKPVLFIALYEGHAWERLSFKAARRINKPPLCVGYQHTTLRQHAYAMRRSLEPHKGFDPDIILCSGEITRNDLSASPGLSGIPSLIYGTHRCPPEKSVVSAPSSKEAVLVLPEGLEEESIFLFEFSLNCARLLPNVFFIFRTHPVLPFEKIKSCIRGINPWPSNVEISRESDIEKDYHRARCLLYRGSSTAIYAVLAGLKPFYVNRSGEMNIDPLYALKCWREQINSEKDMVEAYKRDSVEDQQNRLMEWQNGKEFCLKYVEPIRPDTLDEVLNIAQRHSAQPD